MKKSTYWTLLAALFWFVTGQSILAQSRTEHAVEINLRNYGWEPPDRHEHNSPSIAVDNEGRVLVGFTVRARGGLVTRSQPRLDFRIIRFSPDGKVDLSLSLPTHVKGINGIYLSDTDQIIARANDSLQILQADDGNLQKGVWKTLCAEWCGVSQSPTRHTLVLHIKGTDRPSTIIRFSPQLVLQPCGKAPQFIDSDDGEVRIYPRYITDEFAYFWRPGPDFWRPSPESFGYRWPLCNYDRRVDLPLHGAYRVLNDKFFVVQTQASRVGSIDRKPEVISQDGQVKFQLPMLKDESSIGDDLKAMRSDASGDRLAVVMVTTRGGNMTLDISNHVTALRVAVYDIEAGKEIASIPGNPKFPYGIEFDLSPDGRHLAIRENDIVRIFVLEGATKPEQHNGDLR